jgi:hypothetical protein
MVLLEQDVQAMLRLVARVATLNAPALRRRQDLLRGLADLIRGVVVLHIQMAALASEAAAGGGGAVQSVDIVRREAAPMAAGWPSFLVLTGISTREDVRAYGFAPTYIWDDLSLLTDPD